jgi:hypothetical protein
LKKNKTWGTASTNIETEDSCNVLSFALSLVSTLRSLPEANTLQARIEILSSLQKFKFQSITSIFHQNLRGHPAPLPSIYQLCNEQYHPISTQRSFKPTVHNFSSNKLSSFSALCSTVFSLKHCILSKYPTS